MNMLLVMLSDKKSSKTKILPEDVSVQNTGTGTADATGKSSAFLKQARAILLEANISGANVKEAQELFKKALRAHREGDYGKSMDLAMECIDLVDSIMKNE